MQMPLLLPAELNVCRRMDSDESLLKLLLSRPPDLIQFLEIACADETWAEAHSDFMRAAIDWAHQQFFQDQLMIEFAYRLAVVFRRHPGVAAAYLPNNIIIKLQDADLSVNTLMYGSSSHYLKGLIRLECRDRMSDSIHLNTVPFDVFEPIHEYIMKGYSDSLSTISQTAGEQVLKLAQLWDLKDFVLECQKALKKWIHQDNVLDILLMSHKEGWLLLRASCYEFLNDLQLDVRLWDSPSETLKFEFLRFSENSLDIFQRLKMVITHLVFGGKTSEQPEFSQVVAICPGLIGLDLSYTDHFSDFLYDIPSRLRELILGSCTWVNEETLIAFAKISPHLLYLSLTSNPKLNYSCWPVLQRFKSLYSLDLSRNAKITDEDLRLVLESCNSVVSLNLEECRSITDKGFGDMPHLNPGLNSLNLSRTMISDLPLIEIATYSPDLLYLNLTRCERITDKGIFEALRAAKKLTHLVAVNTGFTAGASQLAKKIKPYLVIEN